MNNWVREKRQGMNLTQTDLAKILGVTTGTVSQWEVGAHVPNEQMLKLAFVAIEIRSAKDRLDHAMQLLAGLPAAE